MSSKKLFVCIFEYLYIILAILESNTVYSCSEQFSSLPFVIVVVCLMLFIAKMNLYGIKRKRLNKLSVMLICYLLVMAVFAGINVSSSVLVGFVCRFMIFIPVSIGIFYLPDNPEANKLFLERFVKIICFLAITSLFFWLFGSTLKIISPNMTYQSYWARDINFKGYFGLLFENQYDAKTGIYRNDGIFPEGPMYCIWLVFALCFEMYNLNTGLTGKKHKYKVVLLIATILSTITTSGILAIAVLFLFKLLSNGERSKKKKLLTILMTIAIIFAIASPMITLVSNKLDSYSGITRLGSIMSSLYSWLNHPLFGNGYNSMSAITNISYSLYGRDTGNSNTLFMVLAQGGLVLASVYLVPIIFTLIRGLKNKNNSLIINAYIVLFELLVTWIPYKFSLLMVLSLFSISIFDKKLYIDSR